VPQPGHLLVRPLLEVSLGVLLLKISLGYQEIPTDYDHRRRTRSKEGRSQAKAGSGESPSSNRLNEESSQEARGAVHGPTDPCFDGRQRKE